ncbi:hypothetical protein I6E11_03515 [Bacteroides caecigallinarum]|uniref:hypothetical protein n=1 Tax=Bacteroides caecigallinarum TaxID=1411144 RepID=UPI001F38FB7F|nr:hypothetical protein [Bacteroides caecigallinarum]MCF2592886.1 hypothetical protein [Bacteroides caecigallinarum]
MKEYKNLEQQLGIDTSKYRIVEKSLLDRYNTTSPDKINPVSFLSETPVSATLVELSLIEVTVDEYNTLSLDEAISSLANKAFVAREYQEIRKVIKEMHDNGSIVITL